MSDLPRRTPCVAIKAAALTTAMVAMTLMGCSKPAASAAPAYNAPAATDPAAMAGPNTDPVAAADIDYGLLGSPPDVDPNFANLSAARKLAKFRYNERHPLQAGDGQLVSWLEIAERENVQRALFYAAVTANPSLATTDDWNALRKDEQDLIETSCQNRDDANVPYQLSEQQCASVSSGQMPEGAAQ